MSRKKESLSGHKKPHSRDEHTRGSRKDSHERADVLSDVSKTAERSTFSLLNIVVLGAVAALVIFNQLQLLGIQAVLSGTDRTSFAYGSSDLSSVSLSDIKSTGHSLAAIFPLEDVKTAQDAMNILVPTGTPEYGKELGVSYDNPVGSLNFMARQLWPEMRKLKTTDPEVWKRYVNLAGKPVGISCEFCCGVEAVGIRPDGESICGCQHNPALLGLTLWLMKNRPDMTDAEILREVLRWKALFFPKNMVGLAVEVSGKSASELNNLPGMVGGC